MQDQLFNILYKLLVTNTIKLNKEELKLQLLSHPSYPSLHSVTGVLKHFGVPNLALQVPTDQETLDQLPTTFIANVAGDKGNQLALIEKKKGSIQMFLDQKQTSSIATSEFLERWDGIIIAVEKDETVIEERSSNSSKIWQWLLIITLGVIGVVAFKSSGIFEGIHYFLSGAGLILSVLIVSHALGIESASTASICNLSEKTSCDAVLNSKGAKIGGLLTLSDASILAFAGYLLFYSLALLSNTFTVAVIASLTLLSIPFILYSVYYQASVLKKWCPLCLGIVGVLVLQVILLFATGNFNAYKAIAINDIGLYAISLLIVASLWFYIKPLLNKKVALQKLKIESNTFKRNFSLFHTLLKENDTITNDIQVPQEIVLGNKDALIDVILVTSPLCFYCKKAHSDIENILKQADNQLKIIIRFNVRTEDVEDVGYQVTSHLIHAYNTEGELSCLHMMDEVYKDDVDLKQWLKQRKPLTDPNKYIEVLNTQKEWCTKNNINFTPALYILGKQFPKEYDRNDISLFTEDLVELLETQATNVGLDDTLISS